MEFHMGGYPLPGLAVSEIKSRPQNRLLLDQSNHGGFQALEVQPSGQNQMPRHMVDETCGVQLGL